MVIVTMKVYPPGMDGILFTQAMTFSTLPRIGDTVFIPDTMSPYKTSFQATVREVVFAPMGTEVWCPYCISVEEQ